MLILTRKIGESVIIGDNIRVAILEVRGKQIRLGIDAPPDVVVLREEIHQRLVQENQQAANFSYQDLLELVAAAYPQKAAANPIPVTSSKNHAISIDTRDLGPAKVKQEHLVTFASGLPGFPKCRSFALLEVPALSPILYLQCVDDCVLAFPVAEPARLVTDYQVGAPANALKELMVEQARELRALVMLTIPPGNPRETTANLLSPILINPRIRQGKQIMMENSHFSHRSKFPFPCQE